MYKKCLLILITLCLPLIYPKTIFANAKLFWSTSSTTVPENQLRSVDLNLDTDNNLITGVDVVLVYDSTQIDIEPVITASPAIFPVNFFLKLPTQDPTQAQIRLTSSGSDNTQNYFGWGSYAHLIIKPLTTGSSQITFLCQDNQTNDTNIAKQQTSQDLVDCSLLSPLAITITPAITTSTDSQIPDVDTNTNSNQPAVFAGHYFADTSCDLPQPPSSLIAQTIDKSTVLLSWERSAMATDYSLMYGFSPDSYQYGINNIGNVDQFLVDYLSPNTTHFFGLAASNTCGVSTFATISKKTAGNLPDSPVITPEIVLEPELMSLIPSVNQIINPTLGQTAIRELMVAPANPQPSPEIIAPSNSPNIWTQMVIIFLPLIIIFIVVNILFFMIKYRRSLSNKQTYGSIHTQHPVAPSPNTPQLTANTQPVLPQILPTSPINPSTGNHLDSISSPPPPETAHRPPAFASNLNPLEHQDTSHLFNTDNTSEKK